MNTTKFFGEKLSARKMFTLGGLFSFYQFTYQNVRIVLLGEIHDTMSRKLAMEYIKVLNEFIIDCDSVTILLESIEGDEKNNSEQLSFMDSILLLSSANLSVQHADKRHYNEGFTDLFLYFKTLSELPPSKTSHFDNPKFTGILHELAEDYNKKFSFSDLFNLFNLEIESLTQLEKKVTPINLRLSDYIHSCIKNIVKALDMAKSLEKENSFTSSDGERKESDSILDICIERMEQTKSFEIIIAWLEIYYLYEIYHFDATLMMDLWQTLHQKDNSTTVIIVSGNTHTEHLANLLKLIAIPVDQMTSEQQESRISPVTLEELLISPLANQHNAY
ncbi:hypothetical protein [Legionella maioricensis]|uniref:Uncharacterized protein n=1 Tax=Legionella maioricensis TaxID=2896528 RepID=A0A9X2D025_9GAMM|nr:hypothetical protein [Legionella maioricensis]MCL9683834.1 hypothetical protein [Legionella maioricensis]MCL9686681.1 hypothetical protein [Legionella maioricensis]